MKITRILLSCLLLLNASYSIAEQSKVLEVSQNQVMSFNNAAKTSPFVVLDVRSEKEFAEGHIKGAMNLPHKQILERIDELAKYKDTLVIVHCRSGARAAKAIKMLQGENFSRIGHLSGDYLGWKAADLPLEK